MRKIRDIGLRGTALVEDDRMIPAVSVVISYKIAVSLLVFSYTYMVYVYAILTPVSHYDTTRVSN